MKKYEFLEHTADAKFVAYGKSLEECFANAAEAMTAIMTDPEKVEPKLTKSISVTGTDLKNLLYNFLEEFLIMFDSENFVLHKVRSVQINPKAGKYILAAVAVGDTVDERYEIETGIKAVTYMDMEVKEDHVQVVVDI